MSGCQGVRVSGCRVSGCQGARASEADSLQRSPFSFWRDSEEGVMDEEKAKVMAESLGRPVV